MPILVYNCSQGVILTKTIIYGNIAKYFGKKRDEDGHTHAWTCYLRPFKNEVCCELTVRIGGEQIEPNTSLLYSSISKICVKLYVHVQTYKYKHVELFLLSLSIWASLCLPNYIIILHLVISCKTSCTLLKVKD